MSTKLKLLYVIFFFAFLITVIFGNYFYKTLIHIQPGHKYNVSAEQYYGFKSSALKKVIKKAINQFHILRNIKVVDQSLTLNKIKTAIQFDLELGQFVDESELELSINKIYIGSIKQIVEDFNSNRNLYDFEYLEKMYEEEIYQSESKSQQDIKDDYNELTSSSLYLLYPPKIKCFFKSEQLCLNKYKRYYRDLYEALNVSALAMEMSNFENVDGSNLVKEAPVFEILAEFEKQKALFQLPNQNRSFLDYKKKQYFEKKYFQLLNTDFFSQYMPEDFCLNYNDACFKRIGENFNKILSRHQLEMNLPFKVKYKQEPKETKPKFISELPLNIALASIATYLFFIFTNKYFRIKIK
ncbi:hypothetical protein OAB21_02520 [Candidatus Pelagibacter sp.]|nr:hypothetical protein [Candidatus Pelagibacter sp.]